MARVTYVKAAQQRYKMVPVLDADGNQVITAVTRKNGDARVTKRGREVTRRQTVADKSQPLPPEKCGKCGTTIEVGMPYKHISPKSGPYGGRRMVRCASCPSWQVWEYSSSLSARTAEIAHDFWNALAECDDEDSVQTTLNDAAERVREIAEEKREGASNIEEGFGHSTYQSDELNDIADQLDSWADEIEGATIPEYPEAEEQDCEDCEGSGEVENEDWAELDTEHEELLIKIRAVEKRLAELKGQPFEPKVVTHIPGLADITDVQEVTKMLAALKKREAEVEEALADIDATTPCDTCDGSGRIEPDEPTDEQIADWKSECESDLSIVDECPV